MQPTSVLLAAWLAAGAPTGAGAPACQGTVSGSVQGAFSCSVSLRPGDEGMAVLVIEAVAPIPGVPAVSPGAFEIPEPVREGVYTLDTLGQGLASLAAEGGTLYTAARTSGKRGEVQVTLTEVRADPERKGHRIVRGVYRARLVPVGSGRTGSVVIEVRF
ncbi:MAG: hypothetical protein WB493_10690 [Anaeromyxobacteraceae bacterium]